ncbi:JmjC domain-containing protein [Streptomyces avicenniae]|uniref:JmjC domain-containing protein n=1 Tax=Streptomyces avicenniae TaxID=500153 RepID=UPI00069B386D|nr:cupin domain-containing protein [Streptomyces avicenniae]
MDCLLRLVDDIAILESAWEREPVLSTGLDDFGDLLSLAEVDAMLARGFPVDSVRLVLDGRAVPAGSVAADGRYGRSAADRVTDGAKVARRIESGATLILENLKAYCPAVAEFAAAVSEATGYDTYCTAFLTPAGHPGVAPHHDTASVFVRQLSGSKHWRVSRPVEPWPLREHRGRRTAVTEPVVETTLRVGDCLYVPRGFVHAAEAASEPSLHLSVALRPVTWGLLLRQMVERAADGRAELREALPPAFSGADREALLRERAAVLAACLEELTASGGARELMARAVPGTPVPGALLAALRGGGGDG